MDIVRKFVKRLSKRARQKRAIIFHNKFHVDKNTRILDLGSDDGSNIYLLLEGKDVSPANIYIADIDQNLVQKGAQEYGFTPVAIGESETLPFEDEFFDIVYCSSVIEHVTAPKKQVWNIWSGKKFKELSLKRQQEFAAEIRRVGKQYFVQTPYRHYIIESHSWLPFIAWLPRWLLIVTLHLSNILWVKKTYPDFYLLNRKELSQFFSGAEIVDEKFFLLTKSIMAIKC